MQPIVVLARRHGEDPKSTVSRFCRVRELDADREVKKQVSEERGLNDEDLPWVTVAHPFSNADSKRCTRWCVRYH
jgi:hypothetical protein